MRPKPIFVDLFSGAGGMSLGLELAGLERVLAVEASPMAGQTYYRNLIDPELDAWETHRKAPLSDQLSSGLGVAKTSDVLDDWTSVTRALRGREVDLVAGGPPCQGFSLAGLRRPGDARKPASL